MITDEQIRGYRNALPGDAVDARLICQIALGNRSPFDGMSQAQARTWVERAAEKAR